MKTPQALVTIDLIILTSVYMNTIEKKLFLILRIVMGLVFLYASYDKILHPMAFAKAVYNYQILPDNLINLFALLLPWLELIIGVCLIVGKWLPGATCISTGLLAIFIGALIYNHIRGLNIHCGCFSTETTEGPADMWTVARDVLFFILSGYLTIGTMRWLNSVEK